MRSSALRIGSLIVLAILLLGGLAPAGAGGASNPPQSASVKVGFLRQASPPTNGAHPKLESALHEVASAYQTTGAENTWAIALKHGIQVSDGQVRVVVDTGPGGIEAVAAELRSRGGKEEARHDRLLQARVPVGVLMEVSDLPQVGFVRRPFLAQALPSAGLEEARDAVLDSPLGAVISEGVQVIGADVWQNAGLRGQGVKVAVIDLGFSGYQARLGAELPPSVVARSFRVDGDIAPGGERHGTACAEIVHSVAPEAQLYLLNFETEVEWANAVDFAISQGVHVVSSSVANLVGPFDGTGFFSDQVTQARNAGVFWAQSAGNYAQNHWQGNFNDPDGNGRLEFAPGAELNTFSASPNSFISIFLSWNDWPASNQDYDMLLFQQVGGNWVEVDSSTNVQSGTQPPVEIIVGSTGTGGTFGIAIQKKSATRDVRFQLFTIDVEPQFQVAAASLGIPADSPGAVAAGATNVASDALEPFSSQGPTVDGRTKPDLAAPDGVSTATFGPRNFLGTSASAPHLAGAAALLESANPALGPAGVQGFLEARAVHLGAPGKNSQFGSGRLSLGPPGTATPGPPGPLSAVDSKIEIVFPHDAAGNPTGVTGGNQANVGAFLFAPSSLTPVPCSFSQPVRLFRALNNGVAEQVGAGTPTMVGREGKQITMWQYNDVDVAAATNPLNKYYFLLSVDGLPTNTNIWSHGEDARTIFPQQDVVSGVGSLGSTVDAKIEIVFPHDAQGNPKSVEEADLANVGVDVFATGTLVSAPQEANLTVRLLRSLNNGVQELVGVGQKQTVSGGVAHPRWLFNDVDVSASRNPLNKYYFRAVVDGVATRSNVWSHGADARTIFPTQDVPTSSCQ